MNLFSLFIWLRINTEAHTQVSHTYTHTYPTHTLTHTHTWHMAAEVLQPHCSTSAGRGSVCQQRPRLYWLRDGWSYTHTLPNHRLVLLKQLLLRPQQALQVSHGVKCRKQQIDSRQRRRHPVFSSNIHGLGVNVTVNETLYMSISLDVTRWWTGACPGCDTALTWWLLVLHHTPTVLI